MYFFCALSRTLLHRKRQGISFQNIPCPSPCVHFNLLIILFLLISLVTASLAQRRVLKKAFMSIPEIEKFVSDTYANTLKKSEQLKQWVQVVGDVQVSLQNANDNRVKLIRISMGSFFVSIAFIVLWYLIALSKML